ncbi:LAMI_0F06568g1_1 [Lachancea mirantina]|uniref:LAMI_0F06568g1_1 n=1 Tax=Lachancea mirantina TaxID=1230905 RepID=A0A1G4JZ17_9SACH|nr:LAMI_0F06568g1_1 [Lachancea mirantina]
MAVEADSALIRDGSNRMDEELLLENAPLSQKLRNLTYLTFLLLGVALLWPWNSFLSATSYFQQDVFGGTSIYAKIYVSTMMSISTISSVVINLWLSRRQHSYSQRVVRGLVWEVLVFGSLCALVSLHKLLPQGVVFSILMILVLVSAAGTAMTQNGCMAIANLFGSEFSQAVMMGQAVAGFLPSIALFGLSFIGEVKSQSSLGIFVFFLTTVLISIAATVAYRAGKVGACDSSDLAPPHSYEDQNKQNTVPFAVLYSKLKYVVLAIFTAFVVTLTFPVFAANTLVMGLPLHNSQFIPLVFTIWNLGDLYGRSISDHWVFQSTFFTPWKIFLYSVGRFLLVPIFFFFNINGTSHTSNRVLSDMCYLLLQFIFGVTNGNVVSISFMKVPTLLQTDQERKAAGGFTNIFLSTGLALGSVVSYGLVFFLESYK